MVVAHEHRRILGLNRKCVSLYMYTIRCATSLPKFTAVWCLFRILYNNRCRSWYASDCCFRSSVQLTGSGVCRPTYIAWREIQPVCQRLSPEHSLSDRSPFFTIPKRTWLVLARKPPADVHQLNGQWSAIYNNDMVPLRRLVNLYNFGRQWLLAADTIARVALISRNDKPTPLVTDFSICVRDISVQIRPPSWIFKIRIFCNSTVIVIVEFRTNRCEVIA